MMMTDADERELEDLKRPVAKLERRIVTLAAFTVTKFGLWLALNYSPSLFMSFRLERHNVGVGALAGKDSRQLRRPLVEALAVGQSIEFKPQNGGERLLVRSQLTQRLTAGHHDFNSTIFRATFGRCIARHWLFRPDANRKQFFSEW
jgi:hypothetical protein